MYEGCHPGTDTAITRVPGKSGLFREQVWDKESQNDLCTGKNGYIHKILS